MVSVLGSCLYCRSCQHDVPYSISGVMMLLSSLSISTSLIVWHDFSRMSTKLPGL